MHLIYLDDSYDDQQIKDGKCAFSALTIPVKNWNETFQFVKKLRQNLKQSDGIYTKKELHAWKFVSGRGDIAERIVSKARRCQIYKDILIAISSLPGLKLFTSVQPTALKDRAFERLLNRLNTTLTHWDSYGILICDEGNEVQHTRMIRKMKVFNPIPSQFGQWDDGKSVKSIPLDRIIEDPFFKNSEHSYFIQMVDFCAYAGLRYVSQLESKNKYGLHQAYELLKPIWVPETSKFSDAVIR